MEENKFAQSLHKIVSEEELCLPDIEDGNFIENNIIEELVYDEMRNSGTEQATDRTNSKQSRGEP